MPLLAALCGRDRGKCFGRTSSTQRLPLIRALAVAWRKFASLVQDNSLFCPLQPIFDILLNIANVSESWYLMWPSGRLSESKFRKDVLFMYLGTSCAGTEHHQYSTRSMNKMLCSMTGGLKNLRRYCCGRGMLARCACDLQLRGRSLDICA